MQTNQLARVLNVTFFILCLSFSESNALSIPNLQAGPPKILETDQETKGIKVLFVCRVEKDPKQVYLVGSFNGWAENQSGAIKNPDYLMTRGAKTGIFFKVIELANQRYAYKFVEEGSDGKFHWFADPFVEERDKDGNSVVDFKKSKPILLKPDSLQIPSLTLQSLPVPFKEGVFFPARSYFLPDERVCLTLEKNLLSGKGIFKILGPFGKMILSEQVDFSKKTEYCSSEPLPAGGYIAQLWNESSELLAEEVTSVVSHPSEDVRYGFYASWGKVYEAEDYLKRGKQFLKTHINAVQFYDWFPAHGDYTPDKEVFEFDPFFGKKLERKDIEGKIEGLKKFRIAPLAYVAPYAASKSVYKKFPEPMHYEDGGIRVFSEGGIQESEESAQKNGRAIWFYLMSIHPGSPWQEHILNELKGALSFGFSGFHVDSYGHGGEEKYFSTPSPAIRLPSPASG